MQQRWGAKLGEVLLALRHISPLQWREALAKQTEYPILNLAESPPDAALLTDLDLAHYIAHHYLPHHREGETLVITSPAPDDTRLQEWCRTHYGPNCRFSLITAREHHQYLQSRFSTHLRKEAIDRLHREHPDLSAQISIWRAQKQGFALAFALILACVALAPRASWYGFVVASTAFYISTLAFKTLLLVLPNLHQRHGNWQSKARDLPEDTLPVYSILVPLYHEPFAVIRQLLGAIHALDYPKTKLDVWLLLEADDADTLAQVKQACPPDYCRILRVEASEPRTKPKACNVALPLLRGEYVTIYDAEDIPAPDQLKLAVAAFTSSSPRLACLQAALNYYNRDENLLARLFSIEYSALFTIFLPALRALHIPLPLGGTSNHIRTSVLRDIGGWDPYNVTEDADLGVRLSYFGYHTDILPSRTLEESPVAIGPWLRQRSRWIKGYIQTWLVYMRNPPQLMKRLGPTAFFGFQMFVGAPALVFLISPLFWALSLTLTLGDARQLALPGWVLACCGITFSLGLALQWLTALRVVRAERWEGMGWAVLLFPLYWFGHSLACIKALWQLLTRPHFWEKTTHGKSRFFATATPLQNAVRP